MELAKWKETPNIVRTPTCVSRPGEDHSMVMKKLVSATKRLILACRSTRVPIKIDFNVNWLKGIELMMLMEVSPSK